MAGEHSVLLSVIIVSWNTRALLERCLHSLSEIKLAGPFEIIVVDNASSDGSVEMVRERFPSARIIANAENLGFARANNLGIQAARGRYLLLLNPDTEVPPETLPVLIRFMESHPEVGVVGPKLVNGQGIVQGGAAGHAPSLKTVLNHALFLDRLFPRWCPGVWLWPGAYHTETSIKVDWVSGAAMLVRASVVQQVGGLDEAYFMYAEDIEWCGRISKAGWKIVCLPSVHVVHYIGGAAGGSMAAYVRRNVQGHHQYYRSRFPPPMVVLIHLVEAVGAGLRWGMHGVLKWVAADRRHEEQSALWGAFGRAHLRLAWQTARRMFSG